MSRKFIAVTLTMVLAAAAVLALTASRTESDTVTAPVSSANPVSSADIVRTQAAGTPDADTDAQFADFKTGFADGFTAGAAAYSYPDQATLSARTSQYASGFEQGYADGQNQRATLRDQLCNVGASSGAPAAYSGYSGVTRRSTSTTRTLGERYERVDRGMGSTARKAILIGAGAATGAGLGAAIGGKKGAAIGALAGGGVGTALALSKKPSRAFNRRVTGKSMLTKTLIGAGAGAAIGALTGGKRGAAAGAAIGGGSGAIWSLMDGRRVQR